MIDIAEKEKDTAKYYIVGLKSAPSDELTSAPVGSAPLLLAPASTPHGCQGASGQEEVPAQRGFSRAINKLAKHMYFLRNIHSCSVIPGA